RRTHIMFVMYYLFQWKPPELSLSEKLWLGKEILKVGPDVFAKALKTRLTDTTAQKKPFTWNDIFEDIRNPPKPEPITKSQVAVVAATAAGVGAMCVAAAPALLAATPAIGAAAGVTYASMWWMFKKIDRWIQDIVTVAATAQIETAKR